MEIDLFAPPTIERESLPTQMTPLPDAELAARRRVRVELKLEDVTLRINVPDPVGFLAMKIRAKTEQRPTLTKDSFDIYAYVKHVGCDRVKEALDSAGEPGKQLRQSLRMLFWNRDASGVLDVLDYASDLEAEEKEQLAQDVVATIEDVC